MYVGLSDYFGRLLNSQVKERNEEDERHEDPEPVLVCSGYKRR